MASLPQDGLKHLAESTGLSVSTVSRVLSGKAAAYRISAETQERVSLAAGQQGIVVNEVARGLRLRTTQTIGLIIPDVSNPFFAALARQVEHLARAKGYSVLLADSQENADVEAESVRLMRSRRVDGLVIAPVGVDSSRLRPLGAESLPLVLVDRIPADYSGPGVTCDNQEAARIAVRHLLDHGHRRIACLQGLPQSSVNQDRVLGYRQALQEAGIPTDDQLLIGDGYAIETGCAAVHQLFEPPQGRPTALLALGNLIALGALQALRALHLQVPSQVSLISFDEQPWAELIDPPLTTLSQPVEALAAQAMDLLFLQFHSDTELPQSRTLLPVSLIQRSSVTAPLPLSAIS
ncbi:MAG: LacI family transcriptional regulator [Prosthecobacter sp.]|nr:LacI family transcriptional regulator [Prosthecobacter sp.]